MRHDQANRNRERNTMARWRYWLYAWMARCEFPEWCALGIPRDRVVIVDLSIDIE